MKLVINILLFLIARILIAILFPVSLIFSTIKGIVRRRPSDWYQAMIIYYYDMALVLDKFGNVFLGPLLNTVMIKRTPQDLLFGDPEETISSCLGRNMMINNLTAVGKALCWVLDKIDKDHCEKAARSFWG